ncbi:hypothetical protein [Streptomyces sp. NBC_01216]|uniref:hypothetical protein n=1 Tax=unclassified Streptomyces TaxID=2593676 RepID=UPI002E10F4F6|nr:hypothetical protein OG393_08410 [Streptomyces sp. NBC_01216]
MTGMARTVRTLLAVVVTAGLLAACGPSGDSKDRSGSVERMNMQGAAERADAMLDATIRAITPEIVWVHGTTTAGSCDLSRRRTVMTVIAPQRRGSFLGVIERFWIKSGYEITATHPSAERPRLYAVSTEGFGISVVFGHEGQAFFEVATPCVTESEVAEPTTKPNGPAYPLGQIPTPNVRSDFWSAAAPAPASS